MFTESLLAAAMTFASWHGDTETPDERSARLGTIVEAIDIATRNAVCQKDAPELPVLGDQEPEADAKCTPLWRGQARELAFLLLTQAYFETRLARHVHAGECRVKLGECDSGKAISLWQLQAGAHLPEARWKLLAGTDLASTTHAALEAARALGRGRNYCGSVSGAIALYATGRTCYWKPARQRASFLRRLSSRY